MRYISATYASPGAASRRRGPAICHMTELETCREDVDIGCAPRADRSVLYMRISRWYAGVEPTGFVKGGGVTMAKTDSAAANAAHASATRLPLRRIGT